MRLAAVVVLILVFVVNLVPILIAVRWIGRRARAAGVPPGWHVGAAAFGGLIAGLLATGLTVQVFLFGPGPAAEVPFGWQGLLIVVSGLCGSALAAGGACLHLRMCTRRDADYEEPPTGR
jgi:hypothetical protein